MRPIEVKTLVYCEICGKELQIDSAFCGNCGSAQSTPIPPAIKEMDRVGFREAISMAIRNYFIFKGRSTRAEYWWWLVFLILATIPLTIAGLIIPLLGQAFQLFTLIPSISLTARRLHDIGKSGWWQLWFTLFMFVIWIFFGVSIAIFFILDMGEWVFILPLCISIIASIIGSIWWIVWMCRKSDPGPNKYDSFA
tara:strand:+ start:258 stop:842 length:585 start_codon:yes stop_codon:yes gene_type:complete